MPRNPFKPASDYFLGKLMQTRSVEGRLQRAHLKEEHPDRPDIRFEIVRLALNDLWGQVVGRSYYSFSFRFGVAEHSSDAKVTQFDETFFS